MAKILVIDDERSIRNSLRNIFEDEGYNVEVAENGKQGLDLVLNGNFDLVFSDIKMPEMDGVELLAKIKESGVDTPIVMVSGHADIETAVDCCHKGAYDFLTKPFDLNKLLFCTRNALDKNNLVRETKVLKRKINSKYQMVGESEPIAAVRRMIEKVAPTEARVFITGPNGTGKEVIAHLIHEQSNRAAQPLVEVNCAAIPSELIESELFGHVKGSFTGAIKDHAGKFEQADGGTLFLDEIGDMSLAAQAKVLRALQENEISRVGSDKVIKVNVRVIAATNKDMEREIAENRFRLDLYHRLNVINIKVPSLEERADDIPLLVKHFTEQICAEQGCAQKKFTADALKALKALPWPGNIRQLRNVVERLIILSDNEITKDDVAAFA